MEGGGAAGLAMLAGYGSDSDEEAGKTGGEVVGAEKPTTTAGKRERPAGTISLESLLAKNNASMSATLAEVLQGCPPAKGHDASQPTAPSGNSGPSRKRSLFGMLPPPKHQTKTATEPTSGTCAAPPPAPLSTVAVDTGPEHDMVDEADGEQGDHGGPAQIPGDDEGTGWTGPSPGALDEATTGPYPGAEDEVVTGPYPGAADEGDMTATYSAPNDEAPQHGPPQDMGSFTDELPLSRSERRSLLMGRGFVKEVNQEDVMRRHAYTAAPLPQGAEVKGVQSKKFDRHTGSTVTVTARATSQQNRRHKINSLAQAAAAMTHAGTVNKTKAETQAKYGW